MREYYTKEWFPYANAMGISWRDFWDMTPRIIKAHQKGQEESMKLEDKLNWLTGQYVMSAIATVLDNALNGRNAKTEYVEEPILPKVIENSRMTEEERLEIAMRKELLAMEQWIENDKRRGLGATHIK